MLFGVLMESSGLISKVLFEFLLKIFYIFILNYFQQVLSKSKTLNLNQNI